jgi:bifunctional non-homologous end joining protein LigD
MNGATRRSRKAYPRFVPPMECLRVERSPEGERWTYEVKWDGYRTLAVKDRNTVGLYSDKGNSHTEKFPGIAFSLKNSSVERVVLDGEVVALNENGVPDFQQLQNWRTTKYPIVYYVFDVLHRNSTDFLDLTLQDAGRCSTARHEPSKTRFGYHSNSIRTCKSLLPV